MNCPISIAHAVTVSPVLIVPHCSNSHQPTKGDAWWPEVHNRYKQKNGAALSGREAWTYNAAPRLMDREATHFRLCPPLFVEGL